MEVFECGWKALFPSRGHWWNVNLHSYLGNYGISINNWSPTHETINGKALSFRFSKEGPEILTHLLKEVLLKIELICPSSPHCKAVGSLIVIVTLQFAVSEWPISMTMNSVSWKVKGRPDLRQRVRMSLQGSFHKEKRESIFPNDAL